MKSINNQFHSIAQVSGQYLNPKPVKETPKNENGETSFQDILRNERERNEEIRFSKHANQRLSQRDIALTDQQKERLETGMSKAREKGLNDSLVMVDNLAFIVNVKSNTVVTAVNEAKDAVFTNIDGAVII